MTGHDSILNEDFSFILQVYYQCDDPDMVTTLGKQAPVRINVSLPSEVANES